MIKLNTFYENYNLLVVYLLYPHFFKSLPYVYNRDIQIIKKFISIINY